MEEDIEIYSDFLIPRVPTKIQRVTINLEEEDCDAQKKEAIKIYEQKINEGKQIEFRKRMKVNTKNQNKPSNTYTQYRRTSKRKIVHILWTFFV